MSKPSVVALIPARSSSKRVIDKNIRPLQGHPLIAHTIRAAVESGVFEKVIVSTDSEKYAEIARHYGAEVPFLRPPEFAGDKSPDIDWIRHAFDWYSQQGHAFDCFSILRPTSPFRLPETIQRAWAEFCGNQSADSLRAVQKCTEHPGKMWVIRGQQMTPILPYLNGTTPWHSSQYPALPEIYVQNASLEIAWGRVLRETGTIAGNIVMPFLTQGHEGVDINNEEDWWYANYVIEHQGAQLPKISLPTMAP